MTRPPLELVKGASDDDEADEAAVRQPEPHEVDQLATVDVKMAVDPPASKPTMAELVGRWDLSERQAVLPPWMTSWAQFKVTGWRLARFCGFMATYHLPRTPKYAYRLTLRAIVGMWRVIALYWAWLWDAEGRKRSRDAHETRDNSGWNSTRKRWEETVRRRWIGSLTLAVTLTLAGLLLHLLAPPWATLMTAVTIAVTAAVVLVIVGKPETGSLLDQAVARSPEQFRLTSKMILQALGSLNIANINAALKLDPKDAIRFPDPIREDGPGWKATVDLPHGVTAAHIMEKRSELASGLRKPLGCVWPESVPEVHAGRLMLFVGHTEMAKMKPPIPPYVRDGSWRGDAFSELPFGFDQRRRSIDFSLAYGNMLVGALPGAGKSAALRALLLPLSLDVTVEMRIAEHKGSGDLAMFEHLSHFYVSGVTDEDIEQTVFMLRDLLKEVQRRAQTVKDLGKHTNRAPESKVTPETARDRKLKLWPIVVVIDEAQELFTHDDYGKEAAKLVERIIKRGRAFMVMIVIATQRPDAKSVPTGVSGNVSHRFCLRVTGQVENDIVLGTSSYKQGIQATTLTQRDKGVGYLKGAFDDAVVVRTHYLTNDEGARVTARARALRGAAGTLSGHAIGDEFEPPESYNLLDDLQTIFVTSERMHSDTICDRLRELRPDAYADWTAETLPTALPFDMSTTQVKIDGVNKRGLRREQVIRAVAQRAGLLELPSDGTPEGIEQ